MQTRLSIKEVPNERLDDWQFLCCVLFGLVFFFYLVRLLREELQLLQEQGSYVGEVVRAMDKKKVLVKVKHDPKDQLIAFPLFVCGLGSCYRRFLCYLWLGVMC